MPDLKTESARRKRPLPATSLRPINKPFFLQLVTQGTSAISGVTGCELRFFVTRSLFKNGSWTNLKPLHAKKDLPLQIIFINSPSLSRVLSAWALKLAHTYIEFNRGEDALATLNHAKCKNHSDRRARGSFHQKLQRIAFGNVFFACTYSSISLIPLLHTGRLTGLDILGQCHTPL